MGTYQKDKQHKRVLKQNHEFSKLADNGYNQINNVNTLLINS